MASTGGTKKRTSHLLFRIDNEIALAKRAKRGDTEARNQLLVSVQDLIEAKASRAVGVSFNIDRDEWIQELFVAASKYVNAFDPKKAYWRAYVYNRLNGSVIDILRKLKPFGFAGRPQRCRDPLPIVFDVEEVSRTMAEGSTRRMQRSEALEEEDELQANVDLEQLICDVAEVCGVQVEELTLHLIDGVPAHDLKLDARVLEEAREMIRQELQGERLDAKQEARKLFERFSYDDRLAMVKWWAQWLYEIGARPVSAHMTRQINTLKEKAPAFYEQWRSGVYSTPRAALISAGLITESTEEEKILKRVEKLNDRVGLIRRLVGELDDFEAEELRLELGVDMTEAKRKPKPKPLDLQEIYGQQPDSGLVSGSMDACVSSAVIAATGDESLKGFSGIVFELIGIGFRHGR